MADSLARDVREHVISFLADELTLPEFQDWLVGATWDVEARREPNIVDVVYEIKLALAEHSRGDISMPDVRERLRALVEATASVAAAS
jgi:hypothetical protein